MKLKNKKTGEIVRVEFLSNWQTDDGTEIGFRECNTNIVYSYTSLAELNEEWEDYEENKYYYAITSIKADAGITKMKNIHNDMTAFDKSIGNYFENREEAEQAVEKLKAWKRLKDKGFRFHEWYKPDGCEPFIVIETNIDDDDDVDNMKLHADLDLLFGGEDDKK